jgi:hypothetical protein
LPFLRPAGSLSPINPAIDPKLLNDPVFQRVLVNALSIQDRFAAEPVYAKTGKGFLKSAGVEELREIKKARKAPNKDS